MDAAFGTAEQQEETEDLPETARNLWAEPRDLFVLRLGVLVSGDGAEQSCDILALAESGAILGVNDAPREGLATTLELNSAHRFEARVTWSAAPLVGLEFEDREAVRDTLAKRHRAHPYRPPRLGLEAEVVVRLGGECLATRAHDLSEGGIKVELPGPDCVGSEAGVIVPGLVPVEGRVLWWRDGRAGIGFSQPLSFRSLADCITRHSVRPKPR